MERERKEKAKERMEERREIKARTRKIRRILLQKTARRLSRMPQPLPLQAHVPKEVRMGKRRKEKAKERKETGKANEMSDS
eukprot:2228926-Amphidinium_carterae.1